MAGASSRLLGGQTCILGSILDLGCVQHGVCGHPGPDEVIEDAVVRRARQELGLEIRDVTHHVNLSYNGGGFASGYAFLNLSDVLASGMDQAGFGAEFDLTGSGVYDIINYQHLIAVEPACTEWWAVGAFDCIVMSETAEVSPLDYESDGVKHDDGIVLVVNRECLADRGEEIAGADRAISDIDAVGRSSPPCAPGRQRRSARRAPGGWQRRTGRRPRPA